MKATYFLISTLNSQVNGWFSFGYSNSKKELEELADRLWLNRDEYGNLDIYDETYYKNCQIVTKTKANKVFHVI